MRNNKPWAPPKPKTAKKCKPCNGTGQREFWWHGSLKSYLCTKCGGKGWK